MLLSGTSVITCPHTPTLAILASSMVWQSSTSVATRGDTWHHGAERGRHEYIVHLKLHHIIDGSQGLEGWPGSCNQWYYTTRLIDFLPAQEYDEYITHARCRKVRLTRLLQTRNVPWRWKVAWVGWAQRHISHVNDGMHKRKALDTHCPFPSTLPYPWCKVSITGTICESSFKFFFSSSGTSAQSPSTLIIGRHWALRVKWNRRIPTFPKYLHRLLKSRSTPMYGTCLDIPRMVLVKVCSEGDVNTPE